MDLMACIEASLLPITAAQQPDLPFSLFIKG